ncbi:amidase [Salinicola rhizosphaerae]|uniref:Amidase n=1 Tax=Salinicola rhizosphaerae TaxID=1443141 RepID=A0ABQ3DWU9_9GAMM|nr:amidase [Salinicola rhizosphaerae]GHB18818.1 amidase [Salinicola rhizosphaerae]
MSATGATRLADLSAHEALALYASGALSPVELAADCLDRIERFNPRVNAFCHVDAEGAMAAARASEARWQRKNPMGPLDGVPSTIKDLTLTAGMPTRKGSTTTPSDGPWEIDAPFTAQMRKAGAVLLGKTTTPEFGWKGVTDNPLYGVTRNPWNLALTAGGSSGGAGAAAALNLGMLHQGSDAGGSIRIPCGFTGTFGIKPTFGFIPQWPASAMTTLSHLGPMTRTAADSALMLSVVAQPDPRDGYAGPRCEIDWLATPPADLRGVRIAYSRDLGYVSVAPDILRAVDAAVSLLGELGAEVIECDPGFASPKATFDTLWHAGASRLLDGLTNAQIDALDPGLRRIAEHGQSLSLTEYLIAREQRSRLAARMAEFHREFDLLVTPTLPLAPFAAGHETPPASDYVDWVDWTPFSYPFNLTQQPAASLPCGLDDKGLPVGLHLVGPRYRDDIVMAVAQRLEQQLGFGERHSVASLERLATA